MILRDARSPPRCELGGRARAGPFGDVKNRTAVAGLSFSNAWGVTRAALVAAVLTFVLSFEGCAPDPQNVSCRNDGECRDRGQNFNYCLENRCVECVGNARCKRGFVCDDGFCTLR
jgi:hypothetical protein